MAKSGGHSSGGHSPEGHSSEDHPSGGGHSSVGHGAGTTTHGGGSSQSTSSSGSGGHSQVNFDTLDKFSTHTQGVSDRLSGAQQQMQSMNVGSHYGTVGQAFAGKTVEHVQQMTQDTGSAATSAGHAAQKVKAMSNSFRDTEDRNSHLFNSLYQGGKQAPAPHSESGPAGSGATSGGGGKAVNFAGTKPSSTSGGVSRGGIGAGGDGGGKKVPPPIKPKPEHLRPNRPGTIPPELEQLLHGKNVDELVANGTLKPLSGGLTKKVYKVNGHDYVLSTAAPGGNAQQALHAEVDTLGKYHDAGLPTAVHGKMSNGDKIFSMHQGGGEVHAAVQPYQHGDVAQLHAHGRPNASQVIQGTVDGWKNDWKTTSGTPGHAEATTDYHNKLNNLHGDLTSINNHYQNNDMHDLQFFVNKQNGHATLFDPGDPNNSQIPTGSDKQTVSSWPKWTDADLSSLNRYQKRQGR